MPHNPEEKNSIAAKLVRWIKNRSVQEWLMIVAILMLLIMVATRWNQIGKTAGNAFRDRFKPDVEQTVRPSEQTIDSTAVCN